jgi:hypothetical protein
MASPSWPRLVGLALQKTVTIIAHEEFELIQVKNNNKPNCGSAIVMSALCQYQVFGR